jgi:hypothetical protein
MHVLQRPHLSRAVGVSIVAALLAIVITLLFATALGGLSTSGGAGTTARPAVPPAVGVQRAPSAISMQRTVAAPAWVGDPFASSLRAPLP